MAFYPCMDGPHYNPGRNLLIYTAYGQGMDFSRWRLRLCPEHFRPVYKYLSQFKVTPQDVTVGLSDGAGSKCVACLKPAGEADWQFFATCYPAKNEREDYWAKLHIDCSLPPFLREPLSHQGDSAQTPNKTFHFEAKSEMVQGDPF